MTVMRNATLLTCLLPVLLLQSCDNSVEAPEVQAELESPDTGASLEGTSWELAETTVLGGFTFTPDQPDKYTVQFRTDSRLTGKSDCNSFTGVWNYEEVFSVSEVSSTRSMCERGSLHNYYNLYLRDVNGFERDDNQLVLRTPLEDIRIVFTPASN